MDYRFVTCNSMVNTITKKDELFLGNYTVDPYQNCEFGCRYCDSSTEHVVYIKSNGVDLLQQELTHLKKGVIIIGSVHDPYQPAENRYKLTRDILHCILEAEFPCHILTKSSLVLRDIDILSTIDHCRVTISIPTIQKTISELFEPNVPSPQERLCTMRTLSEHNIITGMALIPLFPHLVENELEQLFQSAVHHKAHYLVYKYLELKGDQKQCMFDILSEHYPHLRETYESLYKDRTIPQKTYLSKIDSKMKTYYKKYKIPNTLPQS